MDQFDSPLLAHINRLRNKPERGKVTKSSIIESQVSETVSEAEVNARIQKTITDEIEQDVDHTSRSQNPEDNSISKKILFDPGTSESFSSIVPWSSGSIEKFLGEEKEASMVEDRYGHSVVGILSVEPHNTPTDEDFLDNDHRRLFLF